MTVRAVAALLILGIVTAACAGTEVTGPPEINYGRDICTGCGMSVDDPRFATAYRPESGTDKVFDDLGGMIIYARQYGELDSSEAWVHDFETEEWIVANEAFYVPTGAVATPMGHGILAFSTRERAEAFATEAGGEVITWEVVIDLPVDDGLLGEHHDHG